MRWQVLDVQRVRVFDRDLMRAEDTPAGVRRAAIEFTCAPPLTTPGTKRTG